MRKRVRPACSLEGRGLAACFRSVDLIREVTLLGRRLIAVELAAFLHGLHALFLALGAFGGALDQLGCRPIRAGLLGAVALARSEADDPGVAAFALCRNGVRACRTASSPRRACSGMAAAWRRVWRLSRLARVIIRSTSGRAALALGTVVMMRARARSRWSPTRGARPCGRRGFAAACIRLFVSHLDPLLTQMSITAPSSSAVSSSILVTRRPELIVGGFKRDRRAGGHHQAGPANRTACRTAVRDRRESP